MDRKSPRSKQIDGILEESMRRSKFGLKATYTVLILGGSLIAAVAGFLLGTADTKSPITTPTLVAGMCGAMMTFLGGLLAAYVDEDPREAIAVAREAAVKSEGYEQLAKDRLSLLYKYQLTIETLKSLYLVMSATRGVIERAIVNNWFTTASVDHEQKMIASVLEESSYDIRVSFGFEMADFWTLVVYRTEHASDTSQPNLCAIAHLRSVDCELSKARQWPIGVGIGGMALAKNREVVAPDLDAPKVGSAFRLNDDVKRETDDDHYKSMFAVPISVGSDSTPWGVVVATSNVPSHFGSDDSSGLAPEETVRALAGIFALIVAVGKDGRD